MRAIIRERRVLTGLQSASALEHIGDFYFVIGDDSPNLVRLDSEWNVVGSTPLFESIAQAGERIVKMAKPDLEALCCVEWNSKHELLCFGSGSKSPARDVCYRVDVTNPASPQNVRVVALTALYDSLRANLNIVGAHQLNLEAASCTHNAISLFQRGNISGNNVIVEYELRAFMQFLDAPASIPPMPHLAAYALPHIQNRRAGFSAATTHHDSILFSASVEDTDNEIDDGATLGSFIGLIQANELLWISVVAENGAIAPIKIEGLALSQVPNRTFHVLAVTDNDAGASEILQIEIS